MRSSDLKLCASPLVSAISLLAVVGRSRRIVPGRATTPRRTRRSCSTMRSPPSPASYGRVRLLGYLFVAAQGASPGKPRHGGEERPAFLPATWPERGWRLPPVRPDVLEEPARLASSDPWRPLPCVVPGPRRPRAVHRCLFADAGAAATTTTRTSCVSLRDRTQEL